MGRTPARPVPRHQTSSLRVAQQGLEAATSQPIFPLSPEREGTQQPATDEAAPVATSASGGAAGVNTAPPTNGNAAQTAEGGFETTVAAGDRAVAAAQAARAPKGGPPVVLTEATVEKRAPIKGPAMVELPRVRVPDLTSIRSPVVRMPPRDALKNSQAIQRDTGDGPSQHHANIQSAVFKVAEATRKAQRDMVQGVGAIAVDARWSIEGLAGQVDSVVEACVSTVRGAALVALRDIQSAVERHEGDIAGTGEMGQAQLTENRNSVSAQIVTHLHEDGSAEMQQAHEALVKEYDAHAKIAGQRILALPDGNRPELFTLEGANLRSFEFKEDRSGPMTFEGQAQSIGQGLYTSPQQPPATPFYTPLPSSSEDPYYRAFIARGHLLALDPAAAESLGVWTRGATERVTALSSEANRNSFILTSLGLVAPAIEALKTDRSAFQETVHQSIEDEHGEIGAAQTQAIIQMRSTLLGVEAFFDPSKGSSQPAKVIKGLRESGTSIKQGLLNQAQIVEASLQVAVADMALAYPDITARLEEMLGGDDLMDARLMLPRIAGVSDSVQGLLLRHLGAIREQAESAKDQSRQGFYSQVKGLWKLVDNTKDSFRESHAKARFHFAMEAGLFTGVFDDDLRLATQQVRGYADEAARAIMAPVRAGQDANHRVKIKAKDHFNSVLVGEYSGYTEKVQKFGVTVGAVPGEDGRNTGTPFDLVATGRHGLLLEKAAALAVALPNPKLEEIGACAAIGVAAAPFSGGLSLAVTGAALVAGGYFVYSSIPDKDDTAKALSLPWPGALAMEAIWYNEGPAENPSAKTRLEAAAQADVDPDWALMANLFSPDESVAAGAKSLLITNAERTFGINDEAVQALAQSFSPTELALLDQAQVDAMSASIVDNLDGVDLHVTQAYIDGAPARAAAIRVEEALRIARGNGDADMRAFGDKMNTILNDEMRAAGHVGYIPQSALTQMSDEMYVEFAARIPAPGDTTRALSWNEPDPVSNPEGFVATLGESGLTDVEETQQQQMASERFANRSDPASVEAARSQFLEFATRDYIQADSAYAHLSGEGDGFLYDRMNMNPEVMEAVTYRVSDTRRMGSGLIIDQMGTQARTTLTAYVNQGATPQTYRDTQAAQSLLHTENSWYWGTTEADLVSLLQQTNNTQLNLAQNTYERLRDDPDATAQQRFEARAAMEQAQAQQDTRIMSIARQMSGNADGPMDQERANQLVADRITTLAKGFDARLGPDGDNAGGQTVGQQIVQNGRMDLGTAMSVATYEAGTHDDLLMQVTSSRSQREIEAANIDEEFLGVGPENMGWFNFGETSGDQAQRLEIALMGVPENDADRMAIEAVRQRHQLHDGTGLLAQMTMSSSWQKDYVERTHTDMQNRIGSALEARRNDPDNPLPASVASMSLDELMPLGGPMDPAVAEHLMDKNGRFVGAGPSMGMLSAQNTTATQAYSAEIARQESFFTSVITAATVAVSLLLLLVPGVNLVAAGVLSALIGGAALIAVKAGMRGDRYGWEEAGVDMARTGVEAAMGGIGGALGGAVKTGGGIGSRLAAVGTRINKTFGTAGGAAIREGITSATSGVANAAMDDKIWSKGPQHGFGKLMRTGLVSGVSGAVSGSVSDVLSNKVTKSLTPGLDAPQDMTRMMKLGDRLGATGRDAMQEVISGTGGAISSEGVTLLNDLAEGKNPLKMEQVLARLGKAAFKEMLTGAARAGIKGHHRTTYLAERDAIMRSGDAPTPEQAAVLRKLAISAGMDRPGQAGELDGVRDDLKGLSGDVQFFLNLTDARDAFQSLPPALQRQARGMSYDHIQQVAHLRAAGPDAAHATMAQMAQDLANTYPHLNPTHLLGALIKDQNHHSAMAAQRDRAQTRVARRVVFQHLPPAIRAQMPEDGFVALSGLPKTLQQDVARLVSDGDAGGELQSLLQKVASQTDATPEHLSQLGQEVGALIEARPMADAVAHAHRTKIRNTLAEIAPEGLQNALSDLNDAQAGFVHRVLTSDTPPSTKVLQNLYGLLASTNPEFSPKTVAPMLQSALGAARSKRLVQMHVKEAETASRRAAVMEHIPSDLRGALSGLRPKDLMAITFGQLGAATAKPADIDQMIARAKQRNPDLNPQALRLAIASALGAKPLQQSFFQRVQQRRALLGFVPKALRARVRRTPILSVSDKMFAAYVQAGAQGLSSGQHNAATLLLNGQVVILVRRNAPELALREEGVHVVQLSGRQQGHPASHLTEENMSRWPELPIVQQVNMARAALHTEISAHNHMQGRMDVQLSRKRFGRRAVSGEADLVDARLGALKARLAELSSLGPAQMMAMQAGLVPSPVWLAQPARLFNAGASLPRITRKRLQTAENAEIFAPAANDRLRDILDRSIAIAQADKGRKKEERLAVLVTLGNTIRRSSSPELDMAVLRVLQLPDHMRNNGLAFLKTLTDNGRLRDIVQDKGRSDALAEVMNIAMGVVDGKLVGNVGGKFKLGTDAMSALIDQIRTSPHGGHGILTGVLRNIGAAMGSDNKAQITIAKKWLNVLTRDLSYSRSNAQIAELFNVYFLKTGQVLHKSDLKSAQTDQFLQQVTQMLQSSPSESERLKLESLIVALRENGGALQTDELMETPSIKALAEAVLDADDYRMEIPNKLALETDDKVRNLLDVAIKITRMEGGEAYDTQRVIALHLMNAMLHNVDLINKAVTTEAVDRLTGEQLLGIFGLSERADMGSHSLDDATMLRKMPALFKAMTGTETGIGTQIFHALRQQRHHHDDASFLLRDGPKKGTAIKVEPRNHSKMDWEALTGLFLDIQDFGTTLAAQTEADFVGRVADGGARSVEAQLANLKPQLVKSYLGGEATGSARMFVLDLPHDAQIGDIKQSVVEVAKRIAQLKNERKAANPKARVGGFDEPMVAVRIGGANGETIFYKMKSRTDGTLKRRKKLVEHAQAEDDYNVPGAERILSPFVGPKIKLVLGGKAVKLQDYKNYGALSDAALDLMAKDGPNFMMLVKQALSGDVQNIDSKQRDLVMEVAGLISGSEANRDPMAYFSILMGLYASSHLQISNAVEGKPAPPSVAQHFLANNAFRTGQVDPIKNGFSSSALKSLQPDSENTQGRWASQDDVDFLSSFGKALGSTKVQLSGGVMPFTAVKYLDNIEIARLLADRSRHLGETLSESELSGKHGGASVMRRYAELFELVKAVAVAQGHLDKNASTREVLELVRTQLADDLGLPSMTTLEPTGRGTNDV